MSDQSIVPVTQADRDAAGELWREFNNDDPHPNDGLVAVELETTACAFARHRIAEREACAKVAGSACYNPPIDREMEVWNDACDHAAAAIRARSDRVDEPK